MPLVFDTDEHGRLGGGRVNGKEASSVGVDACRHWRAVRLLDPKRKYLELPCRCADVRRPRPMNLDLHKLSISVRTPY